MIRPGRDEDAAGYIALIAACWSEYPGVVCDIDAELPEVRALASYMAGKGGALWTAEAEGGVIGMVATYPAEDGWHLSRMYVSASHRGTGLAQDLIKLAEDHARAAGARRMVLWSDVLFTRAHAFYEKHGYLRRGGLRALNDLSDTIEARFTKPLAGRVVEVLDVAAAESAERPFSAMLQACVAFGAATPFLAPLPRDAAMTYWRGVTRAVGQGEVRLFAGWRNGRLAGALQLGLAMPQNQAHRADIRLLLIAPGSRCQGLARRLLAAAEDAAREAGRSLLVLEQPCDDHSDEQFRDWGWQQTGLIPGCVQGAAGEAQPMRIYVKAL